MDSCAVSMPDMLALPFVALSVGSYLDIPELATCEKAQVFSPCIFERLWEVAGSKLLASIPLWSDTVQQFVENGFKGKMLVSQMPAWRRAVFPSKSWRPWIMKTSLSSIKATPPLDLHQDQREESLGVHSTRPDRASVAVAVGANKGQKFVIGMKCTSAGAVNDDLCIGIEALGCNCSGRMMAILFAPFAGNCFIEHENGLTMKTQALPANSEAFEVYVWAQVTEKGDIRFLRQFKGGQVEDTGFLPHEMFPRWIRTYFGSMDIWFSGLKMAVDVSVEHSGSEFPSSMPAFKEDGAEIETTWTVLGEENWS